MENVAELYRSPELADIRKRADELGFHTDAEILNTANYGVAQTRKRTIVLGWHRSHFSRVRSFRRCLHIATKIVTRTSRDGGRFVT